MRKYILFIIFIAVSFSTTAQIIDYNNPQEYEINKIDIAGIQYLSKDVLINISGLKVGQIIKVPGDEITGAIEELWEQGLFSDIKISITKIEDNKIDLRIFLQEQPRLYKITITGVNKNQRTDIREKINLNAGKQITDNILNNTENIIHNYYADKGFPNADVQFFVRDDTTLQNTVNLHIKIDKKNKIKINEIIIRGNKEFSDAKVKRNLKETKQKSFFRIWKISKYIKSKFKEDKNTLIAKYNKEGYRDARIIEDSVYVFDDKMLNVYLNVHEGKKYYYREITWIGNTKYSTEALSKILDIKEGDTYNQERLNSRLMIDEDAVGNLYLDDGYLFFTSTPREVRIDNDSVDIEILITEGQQASLNRIVLHGNNRTNDHVAIRELRTIPGQLFSKSDIIRSVRELAQLGSFDPEQLVPIPIPHQQDATVDIEYGLVEKSNDMFELSGGWGMIGFIGKVGLRFNNFSLRNIADVKSWAPLPIGDGQQLSISANIGANRYQLYSISFVEPWLGGKKPNSLSVSLYYNLMSNGITKKYNEEHPEYPRETMQLYGVALGFGRRLKWPDDYFTMSNEISFQQYHMNGLRQYIDIASGAYNLLTVSTTFGRNSVDNPVYSRRGSNLSLGLKATPPYSLFYSKNWNTIGDSEKFKWAELYKITIKGSWFSQVVGNLVINSRFEYGLLGFYNKAIGYTPFESYVLGGDGMGYNTFGKDYISLRGYKNESLTPINGGHLYQKYTVELRHPILLKEMATIYALGFVEGGNSWSHLNEMDPFHIYRSAGLGVRIFLPMLGMLGIDFGYGFDEKIYKGENAGGFNYHFVFGQQF